MKKLFTLGVLGMCMGLSASAADKPDNDAFYLVGTMTGWACPYESEAAGWEYKLTDEDGDGVFTGAFEIPEGQLEFKLFATPGDWSTADYYGSNVRVFLLQEPYTLMLSPGYGSANINVRNWMGGTFTISARWGETTDGEPIPFITMEGPNQPAEILKPANEAFYLVGSMSDGKTLTADNASEWPYRLTDKDDDGIYTGEFELPAGSFYFNLADDPAKQDAMYGFYDDIYLFNDDTTIELSQYSYYPVTIRNWEGGTVKMSVQWLENPYSDNEWLPRMVITGPEQPARPTFPDIYMIGDFNDWKLPTKSDVNGAVPFSEKSIFTTSNIEYLNQLVDPDDSLNFGLCQLDAATGKYLFFVPKSNVPFTLYNYEINQENFSGVSTAYLDMEGSWTDTSDKKKYTITVKDWKGGNIEFRTIFPYSADAADVFGIVGYNSPVVDFTEQSFYYLIESDGYKEIHSVDLTPYSTYYTRVTGHEVSVILTTENSLDPSPENCWGTDTSLTGAGFDNKNTSGYVSMVKGGEPVRMTFTGMGNMSVGFSFSTSTVTVDLTYIGGPFEAEKIYICGDVMTEPDGVLNGFTSPSPANYDIYEQYWRLDEVEPGVFSKAYYVPEKDTDNYGADSLPQFRFFTDLLGWTREASLGSAEPDFYCLPVDLSEGPKLFTILKGGLGNWGMNSISDGYKWEASWVRIVVDTNTGVVSFEKVTSGVDDVASEGEVSESWYNLQGVKVEKPVKGLYIHVRNGKSGVVMVK